MTRNSGNRNHRRQRRATGGCWEAFLPGMNPRVARKCPDLSSTNVKFSDGPTLAFQRNDLTKHQIKLGPGMTNSRARNPLVLSGTPVSMPPALASQYNPNYCPRLKDLPKLYESPSYAQKFIAKVKEASKQFKGLFHSNPYPYFANKNIDQANSFNLDTKNSGNFSGSISATCFQAKMFAPKLFASKLILPSSKKSISKGSEEEVESSTKSNELTIIPETLGVLKQNGLEKRKARVGVILHSGKSFFSKQHFNSRSLVNGKPVHLFRLELPKIVSTGGRLSLRIASPYPYSTLLMLAHSLQNMLAWTVRSPILSLTSKSTEIIDEAVPETNIWGGEDDAISSTCSEKPALRCGNEDTMESEKHTAADKDTIHEIAGNQAVPGDKAYGNTTNEEVNISEIEAELEAQLRKKAEAEKEYTEIWSQKHTKDEKNVDEDILSTAEESLKSIVGEAASEALGRDSVEESEDFSDFDGLSILFGSIEEYSEDGCEIDEDSRKGIHILEASTAKYPLSAAQVISTRTLGAGLMRFLENAALNRLSVFLQHLDAGDRIIKGKLELFSTDPCDYSLPSATKAEVALRSSPVESTAQNSQVESTAPALPEETNPSCPSAWPIPPNYVLKKYNKELLSYFIATLNECFPDYDFDSLKFGDFYKVDFDFAYNTINYTFWTVREKIFPGLLRELWSTIKEVVLLDEIEVYSCKMGGYCDLYNDENCLFAFNFFFHDKVQHRILFFSFMTKSKDCNKFEAESDDELPPEALFLDEPRLEGLNGFGLLSLDENDEESESTNSDIVYST